MVSFKPKLLFLDIGGVLLSNGWGHESRLEAAKKFNLDYNEMEVLHHFIFNVYEMGKITLDEYLETVVFNHSRSFSKKDFKDFMFSQSKALPSMLEWLIEKKKTWNFRIFSLNNEGKELNDYRIQKFELYRCFDAFISSCEIGMRKPDPEMYQLAIGIAHVLPEQCVYFDDRLMLVEAAKKKRIQAYHHQSFEATQEILENMNWDPY